MTVVEPVFDDLCFKVWRSSVISGQIFSTKRDFSMEINMCFTTTYHLRPRSPEPKGGRKTHVPLCSQFMVSDLLNRKDERAYRLME